MDIKEYNQYHKTHLRSNCFPRLRMGIGRPENEEMVEHVLEPFAPDERVGTGIIY